MRFIILYLVSVYASRLFIQIEHKTVWKNIDPTGFDVLVTLVPVVNTVIALIGLFKTTTSKLSLKFPKINANRYFGLK